MENVIPQGLCQIGSLLYGMYSVTNLDISLLVGFTFYKKFVNSFINVFVPWIWLLGLLLILSIKCFVHIIKIATSTVLLILN